MLPHEYKNHESIQIVIQDRFRGNIDFYIKMIDLFFETLPDYLDSIESGFANKNLEKIKTAAHSIKGSAANLGVTTLQSITQKIELQSDSTAIFEEAPRLIEQLKLELDQFKEYAVTFNS